MSFYFFLKQDTYKEIQLAELGVGFDSGERIELAYMLLAGGVKTNLEICGLCRSPSAVNVVGQLGGRCFLTMRQHRPADDSYIE